MYLDSELQKKSLKKWIRLMLVLLILVILAGVRLNKVTVKGNERYTAEQIEAMVFPDFLSRNTFYCLVGDKLLRHRELPFIMDYDIQVTGPFSCDLVVYEKDMIGYIRFMSSYMYFDKDGVIVENSTEQLSGIPEITGLHFGHIVLNEPLPIEDDNLFSVVMNLTQQLSYYGIESEEIRFLDGSHVKLVLKGGDIEVNLGSVREADTKIAVLSDMLPQLEGLKGTLDLSEYDDSSQRQLSSFKLKKESAKKTEKSEAEQSPEQTGEASAE